MTEATENIFKSTDDILTRCDDGSSFANTAKELDHRPNLWSTIIAFSDVVYVATTGVDDDKIELLGKAMRADEVWAYDRDELLGDTIADLKGKTHYDKAHLRALRDWLRKVPSGVSIWRYWWD